MERFDRATSGERGFAEDWWGKLDDELLDCLACGPMSAAELGRRLGVSEEGAVSLVSMLARDGKVRIREVELA